MSRLSSKSKTVLTCIARGYDGRWEAFCLDFDLAVQGRTFLEVKKGLEGVVTDYVRAAMAEREPARSRLLNRRAPLLVRVVWGFRFLVATISGKNKSNGSTVGFAVSCPA